MKNIKKLLGLFVFICIFIFSVTNVDAKTVEVSTFEEFAKYAQREDTEEEKVTEIKLVNDITISGYVGIGVEDGLTIDLNGKKLDVNKSLFAIMYGASNDGITFYDSATLTFKDSSREKNGVVDNIQTFIIFNSGKDTFDFMEPNEADQDYKLIIDGGRFYQTSILNNGGVTYDSMFSLMEATNEAWHDNVKFTFEVNDGTFITYNNNELATGSLFEGVIEYGDLNENPDLDINLNFKNLKFESKNGQLVKNYNYDLDYKINDVISETSKIYIGNNTLFKEMEITDRTTSVVGNISGSVYSNLMESYEYMKIEYVKWQNEIEKYNFCNNYKNGLHYLMSAFFDYCIMFYGLKYNIAKRVGKFKLNNVKVLHNVYTSKEFKKFIKYVDNEIYKQFFNLMFYTGTRPGEAMALRFSDLNYRCISITKSISEHCINGSRIIDTPKSFDSVRDINIDIKLYKSLLKLKNYYIKKYNKEEDYYIFGGIKPLAPATINRYKINACEKAHLKPIKLHEFRHSHATLLYSNKVDIQSIKERLGHSNINTTMGVYVHLTKKQEKRVVRTLNFLRLF